MVTGDRQNVPKLPGFRWLYHQEGKHLQLLPPLQTCMRSWATVACELTWLIISRGLKSNLPLCLMLGMLAGNIFSYIWIRYSCMVEWMEFATVLRSSRPSDFTPYMYIYIFIYLLIFSPRALKVRIWPLLNIILKHFALYLPLIFLTIFPLLRLSGLYVRPST